MLYEVWSFYLERSKQCLRWVDTSFSCENRQYIGIFLLSEKFSFVLDSCSWFFVFAITGGAGAGVAIAVVSTVVCAFAVFPDDIFNHSHAVEAPISATNGFYRYVHCIHKIDRTIQQVTQPVATWLWRTCTHAHTSGMSSSIVIISSSNNG